MSDQHRSKRRRTGEDTTPQQGKLSAIKHRATITLQSSREDVVHVVTPSKRIMTTMQDNACETSPVVPLSRTLGLFKKYHKQSPTVSPQASPQSARKQDVLLSSLSPSKHSDPPTPSTKHSVSGRSHSLNPRSVSRSSAAGISSNRLHSDRHVQRPRRPSQADDFVAGSDEMDITLSAKLSGTGKVRQPHHAPGTASKRAPIATESGAKVVSSSSPLKRSREAVKKDTHTRKRERDDSAIVVGEGVDTRGSSEQILDAQGQDNPRHERDDQSDADEIVVRSSGRKRTISEKLRAVRDESVKTQQSPSVRKGTYGRSVPHPVATPPARTERNGKLKTLAKDIRGKHMPGKENIAPVVEHVEAAAFPSDLTTAAVENEPDLVSEDDERGIVLELQHPIDFTADQISHIRKAVLAKLTRQQPITVCDLEQQYLTTSALIEHTIADGESNSMLVIGSRGVGKTTMIDQILREQREKHADDFHIVRLNGFIHTDDKLALRDIWRQLGREMEIDNSTHSYADTMSMLLALLSHPLELDQSVEAGTLTKSVIFVLDEFDLFATHPRQTLLYNLFDIAQSRKAPIAVLGVTTRVDAAEQLEKRVKSRFSHRYVHLGLPKSLSAYENICKSVLKVDAGEPWNKHVDTLFMTPSFKSHLRKLYYRTKSIPEFMATMLMPMSTLPPVSTTGSAINEHVLTRLNTTALGTTKLDDLTDLPAIGIAMLVCAARQSIYSIETVSFDVVYEEYKTLASKIKLQATASGAMAFSRVWAKEVAKIAWLGLVEIGFIVDGKVDVALSELADCSADLGQWAKWCKEI